MCVCIRCLKSSCSKLKLTNFAFFHKIDCPFCLQLYFFLLATHFAQILLSKFGQGLPTSPHLTSGGLYRTCHKNSAIYTAMQAASDISPNALLLKTWHMRINNTHHPIHFTLYNHTQYNVLVESTVFRKHLRV